MRPSAASRRHEWSLRRDPRAVLGRRRGDAACGHRLHHHAGQRLLGDAGRQLGDAPRPARVSATPSAPRSTAISSAVLMRRAARIAGSASTSSALGNAIGSSCANVGVSASVPTRRAVAAPGSCLEHLDQRHRIPRQPVEVVVADLVGDALVPRAVQVDLAGRRGPPRRSVRTAGCPRPTAAAPR